MKLCLHFIETLDIRFFELRGLPAREAHDEEHETVLGHIEGAQKPASRVFVVIGLKIQVNELPAALKAVGRA
jgi:hypothetical protein